MILELGQLNEDFSHQDRFQVFSFKDVFSQNCYQALRKGFETVPWERKEQPFYEQYEKFFGPHEDHIFTNFYDPAFFLPFKKRLEKELGFSLQNKARLAAHKQVKADSIGMHNDYAHPAVGHENVRFIFQFSETDVPSSGGELSFWESKYTKKELRKFPYRMNYGVCFQITPYSFHSVSQVETERYTLVLYLWEEGRKVNELANEIVIES